MIGIQKSKLLWPLVVLLALCAAFVPKAWLRLKAPKDAAEPRLAVVEATARINSALNRSEIGGRWKNFGAQTARIQSCWIVGADRAISNIFVCFGDSASPIQPGGHLDFWIEFSPSKPVPPWPEMILLLEARHQSPRAATIRTQQWLGILEGTGKPLANNSITFTPLNGGDCENCISNLARQIRLKENSAH